ncbi:helix-turn-helix transcriptional regulator [Mycoplasmatota bacterium]|nr:helix-turn-helix transcriptional regulator [Mycoplasmatota bacterium]
MTQKQLSDELGIFDSYLRRYESGSLSNPTLDFLMKLKEIFNIPIDDLVFKDLSK